MPAKSITDAFLRNVKLPSKEDGGPKQVAYIDTLERGLALVVVVGYGGSRTFRVLTYRDGKPQSRKLGIYPAMSVKDARAEARRYWQDPQRFEAQAAIGSFKEIADAWMKRHVEGKGLRSRPELERILARYVLPKWKDRPFLEIRRREVNDLLDQIEDNSGPAQANAALAVVRGIMTWHQARDKNYASPIVRGMKKRKSTPRDRILTDEEIRAVWTATEAPESFSPIVRLALLTGQRREKIVTMRWSDINGDIWTMAREDREKRTAGELKLPAVALDLVLTRLRIEGNPYVFASGTDKHFNSWSQRKAELDERLPSSMPAWTIHDLRRTARSLMSRAGVRPDIAERVLGHTIAGVEGVYDRYPYFEEKADALSRLSDYRY
jgi:integrase